MIGRKGDLTDRSCRWCGKGGFADRKCTLDDTLDRWFDNRFPPLSIYHGGRDFLVLAEPLIERMKEKEKDVKVIKVTKLELSEVRPVTALVLDSLDIDVTWGLGLGLILAWVFGLTM